MRAALVASLLLVLAPGLAMAKSPVLVELYTAQGCASCVDANAGLGKTADRPDVLALTFSVDYWDYLGWTDTFAQPDFTSRQKAYVTRLGLREPYTPQVVIDGRFQTGGKQTEKIDQLIAKAALSPHGSPDIAFIGVRRVDVGRGLAPKGGADVWLAAYETKPQDVMVKKGDNRGQTVTHINVVRVLKRLGTWRGRPTAYRLPEIEPGLGLAIIVQGSKGARVLAVGRKAPAAPRSTPSAASQ
jgi:hypothetical protein